MTHATHYPGASRSQDFSSRYVGSTMTPNVVVLHSTETTGWPGYSSGATAPHFTILPNFSTKTVTVHQHFPVNRSARALENRAGGVETNTLNAVQIEMVGTCAPETHRSWGSTPHVYMPEAPDWYLAGVADVLRWLNAEWSTFPLRDAAPRGWPAYPGSYGNGKGQRLSGSAWESTYGVVGHMHVPENVHGDPGAFPIARLIALAKGTAPTTPVPEVPTPPVEAPADVDVMDAANYPPRGYTVGRHIQWLGERLVAHGFGSAYKVGPSPEWGPADKANVQAFQTAQGWDAEDADGYPGPETLRRLAAAPAPPKPPAKHVSVTSEFLNMAGYNGITAPGVRKWKTNTDGTATRVLSRLPDVFNVAELSNRAVNRMRPRLDDRLKGYAREGGSDGRYVYRRTATTDRLAEGVFVTPNTSKYRLKRDDKQAAWLVYRIDGALAMDVSCHTENEAPADAIRVAQALYFLDKALAVAKKYGVPAENVALFGDFNSEALVAQAFARVGWKVAASGNFVGWDGKSRKRFDLALVKEGVKASGKEVSSRGLSDHNGLTLTRELVLH